MNMKDKSVKL